jgi:hypothetical protein
MILTTVHINFEKFCQQLIGMTITKVEYLEINYEPKNPKPYYLTKFENLNSVDFSILFHTDDNKFIDIYWDEKFYQYGIGMKINGQSDFSNFIKWNLSESDLWKKFIGKTITDTKLSWETVTRDEQKSGKVEIFLYPQYITLTFSNNKKIFISAAGFLNQGDSEVFGMVDNLTVTDNEKLARKVKMIN